MGAPYIYIYIYDISRLRVKAVLQKYTYFKTTIFDPTEQLHIDPSWTIIRSIKMCKNSPVVQL